MEYYIYGLKCPIEDKIKYVGASVNPVLRLKSHTRSSENPEIKEWIKELKSKSLYPEIIILEKTNETCYNERESYWINFYKNDIYNRSIPKYRNKKKMILIKKIIDDYNSKLNEGEKKLTQKQLAAELYEAGIYKTFVSARAMLQYLKSGKIKNIKYVFLKFMMKRFNLKLNEIIYIDTTPQP